jgi:hypothetical protein
MTDNTGRTQGPSAEIIDLAKAREEAERKRRRSLENVDKRVEAMNKRFCVVPEGHDTYVYREERDPLRKGRYRLNKFTFEGFRRLLSNEFITTEEPDLKKPGEMKKITRNVADVWLKHKNRRQCIRGPIFDPTGNAPKDFWNLWKGFGVKEVKNHQGWRLMREHIYHVLAAGDSKVYDYILDWAALLLQHPEHQGDVALVFRGEDEGVGKGLFVKALIMMLGDHGFHLHHHDQLRNKFNGFMHQLVLLYIDEAFWAGDKQFEGYLKGIISDEELGIEYKNRDAFQARNYLHIMMSSNRPWVVQASFTSRRFAPFRVSAHRRGDHGYFKALAYELEHGGAEAMLYDLRRRDLSCFEVRDYPHTAELDDQRLQSLDLLPSWWMSVLDRGFVYQSKWGAPSLEGWPEFHSNPLLLASLHQWCDVRRRNQRASDVDIGRFMSGDEGLGYGRAGEQRALSPIGERDWAERPSFSSGGRPDDRQPDLPIDPAGETASPPSHEDWRDLNEGSEPQAVASLDDWRERAVIRKPRQHGYRMGTLEEARARFKAYTGDLPMPWDPIVD